MKNEPEKLIANNKKAYHDYFIEETYERVKELRRRFPHLNLCIDGGIRTLEAQRLHELGVESVVMGSAFFKKVSV